MKWLACVYFYYPQVALNVIVLLEDLATCTLIEIPL